MEERYRILKKLAEGGSGTTYLVWDKRLERCWAMKRLLLGKEGQKEAVQREMAALLQIRREGIPVLADVCYEKDAVCLIMEYMTGVSLEERIRERGPMEEKEAVFCALQIAELVGFLHQLPTGLAHGDLKPLNLMVHQGKIALLDFGGAFVLQDDRQSPGCCFTPGYGAPELKEDGRPTVQSDVYAFGAVLFFMVTGERPESDRGIYPVREQRSRLSQALERLILNCTQAEPEARYGSMEELGKELKALQKQQEDAVIIKNGRGFGKKGKGFFRKSKITQTEGQRFGSIRSVLLTEGTYREVRRDLCYRVVLLLLAGIFSGISGMPSDVQAAQRETGRVQTREAGEILPVSIRCQNGERKLVDFDAVYYTDENPMFELPLHYFEAGREYEVTISQRERESGRQRIRRFVICACGDETGEPVVFSKH